MFYAYDNNKIKEYHPLDKINIEEWRKLIKNQATAGDIETVVYNYSIRNLENVVSKKLNPDDSICKNSFVRYLQTADDREIIDFLILAKRCEQARSKRADKWWYPAKEDLRNYDLQTILDDALAYNGSRLKNRYLLQAVRAAYTMGNYDICLNLWEKQIKHLPRSAVKSMCMGYIGGIWFRKGEYEKAIQFYNADNDYDSFWWCAKYLTKKNSDIERIKILYKYQPSSDELPLMLQTVCRKTEIEAESKNHGWDEYKPKINRKQYMDLRDFALRVAAEKRSNNPAMWQYAAAYLTFWDGKIALAKQYAEKAETLQGTDFIKEKIKVLQTMLEASDHKRYDEAFEMQFLLKLQWLDSLICIDINLKNMEGYDYEKNEWRQNMSIKETYSDVDTKGNYSQYYPFDMMRRIVLGVMLPKYQKQKEYTKALLLAGMASERLRSLVNFKHIQKDGDHRWNTDYSTDIFNYMNRFPVENVIEYQQILQSGGRNEFERFLAEKCYKNDDYLNELIGTKYLRIEKFEEAIPYLSKVSSTYIKSMNVYGYFHLDPFREVYENRNIKPYPEYKLDFAKKMLILQQKMQNSNNKTAAIWQYAIALERSVSEYESWALTTYYMGNGYDNFDNTFNDWQTPLLNRSKKLIVQAGKTMKNSKNPAIRAKYDWYKNVEDGYFWSGNKMYKKFVNNYKNSSDLQQFLSECDNLKSYYTSCYIPEYIHEKWDYKGNLK